MFVIYLVTDWSSALKLNGEETGKMNPREAKLEELPKKNKKTTVLLVSDSQKEKEQIGWTGNTNTSDAS